MADKKFSKVVEENTTVTEFGADDHTPVVTTPDGTAATHGKKIAGNTLARKDDIANYAFGGDGSETRARSLNDRLSTEVSKDLLDYFDIDNSGENDSTSGIQKAINQLAAAVEPSTDNEPGGPNAPDGVYRGGILTAPRGFFAVTKLIGKYGVDLQGAGRAASIIGAIPTTHNPANTKGGADTEYGLIEVDEGPQQYLSLKNLRLQGHTNNWDAQTVPTNPGQRPIYVRAKWNAEDNTATDGGLYYSQLEQLDIRAFDRGPWLRGHFHKNINDLTNQFLKLKDIKCYLEHPIIGSDTKEWRRRSPAGGIATPVMASWALTQQRCSGWAINTRGTRTCITGTPLAQRRGDVAARRIILTKTAIMICWIRLGTLRQNQPVRQ